MKTFRPQNIPLRTDDAKMIRKAFIRVWPALFEADYSKIEPRAAGFCPCGSMSCLGNICRARKEPKP